MICNDSLSKTGDLAIDSSDLFGETGELAIDSSDFFGELAIDSSDPFGEIGGYIFLAQMVVRYSSYTHGKDNTTSSDCTSAGGSNKLHET